MFWALCSSRHTVVTVTSAISLLVGTSLGELAGGDVSRFGALASLTALLVGAMALAAWFVRAGSLVSFVSETVLVGFKVGVALTLASTQIPKLLGMSSPHGSCLHCFHYLFTHLHETNGASVAIGGAALGILIVGKIFFKRLPVALFVVIAGIMVAHWANLGARGVKMLGDVPQGFPPVGLPAVTLADLNTVLPLAMACFLLSAVETTAIGRMFAIAHKRRLDANREFLALAGANLAAGLGHGFPVSGGMSQSLVNKSAGARTPASGLVAGVLMLVVALFLSGMLRDLPQPVLAAVVLMAVASLINVSALKHLWRADRGEFGIAAIALCGVLVSGLLRGVLIGAVISMVLLIRRAAGLHVAFLGRIPGSRRFSDLDRHTDNEAVPGVVIFRPEGSLVYFNADHVHDAVVARVRSLAGAATAAVCDLSASPYVDMAGAAMLRELAGNLSDMGVRLHVVEARSTVRDRLRREGLNHVVGEIDRFTSVADAVDAAQSSIPVKSG